ncbi:acetyl-CoA carboxylase biotin carboxyl carrier protein [Candidatus Dependentiae bacterium]|nr:acetyl-CoA carboxylase biotin carboxyl carrier protein [Candidatus Dependentiae bacterium]
MNVKDIEKIIKMLDGTDISEISIEHEGVKLMLKRGFNKEISIIQAPSMETGQAPVIMSTPAVSGALVTAQTSEKEEYIKITAPMVGTFYRAPSPESAPYVKVGDIVDKETVVCIIETMKVMNEIQAEQQGKIVKILLENSNSVEYGQAMFLLEKI